MSRTTIRTTISRDPALVALLDALPGYPGPSAIIDAGDRAWLREHGVAVGDRPPVVPLCQRAAEARAAKRTA